MKKPTKFQKIALGVLSGFILISLLIIMPIPGEVGGWGYDHNRQSDEPTGNGMKQVAAGAAANLPIGVTLPLAASIIAESSSGDGSEISFDASAFPNTDDKTTYNWDFGDGKTGSGAKVGHTYEKNGEYDVTLTVTSPDGGTDTATISIIIPYGASAKILVVPEFPSAVVRVMLIVGTGIFLLARRK